MPDALAQSVESEVLVFARAIGNTMANAFPPVKPGDHDVAIAIPADRAEDIADILTMLIAEILQAWLDAGSEREVTLEDLIEPITNHVKGWAYPVPKGVDA